MVVQNIILNGTATAVIRKRKQGLSIRTLERKNKLRYNCFLVNQYLTTSIRPIEIGLILINRFLPILYHLLMCFDRSSLKVSPFMHFNRQTYTNLIKMRNISINQTVFLLSFYSMVSDWMLVKKLITCQNILIERIIQIK